MRTEITGPYWSDRPVVLVAGGPSLRGFDFDRLTALDAWFVGVNESIFYLPRCDCGVSVDRVFVEQRYQRLKEKITGGMEMIVGVSRSSRVELADATVLTRLLTNKLSDEPREVRTCGTSGYAALNIAYLKRARKVLLLGYDYSPDGGHYYPDYEWHKPPKRADCWSFWAGNYGSTQRQLDAAGIVVFNASPKSVIKTFPRGTIDEGMAWVSDGGVAAAA